MSRPVRVTLDASAIAAFARGSIPVGEILAEVADEECRFAVPYICLAQAAADVGPELWPVVEVLWRHRRCLNPQAQPDWRDMAGAVRAFGTLDRAAAMLTAVNWGSLVVTAVPDAYGHDNDLVIRV